MQFALHTTLPIEFGGEGARELLWKRDGDVALHVAPATGNQLEAATLAQSIDAATAQLSDALETDVTRMATLAEADIAFVTFDPAAGSAGATARDTSAARGRMRAAGVFADGGFVTASDPDACRTYVWNDAAPDEAPSPFVVITIAEGALVRGATEELHHCVREELGHAMTILADIPPPSRGGGGQRRLRLRHPVRCGRTGPQRGYGLHGLRSRGDGAAGG
ncbi:MAG: hypothetical protein ACU0CI_12500 [Shimia sp.]